MLCRSPIVCSLALLAVASCGSIEPVGSDYSGVNGQPIASIIAKLGKPSTERQLASGALYIWQEQTVVDNVPVLTATTSYASGRPNTTETMVYRSQLQTCTLRIQSDARGLVVKASLEGGYQACGPLTQKL